VKITGTPGRREYELWACPDEDCGHITQLRGPVKGQPPCPRAHHRHSGNYRRMVPVVASVRKAARS
jgi:hypothetical protein